jgi:hypothetical protein
VFHHACKLGPEGIVSKRKDSRYRPAVKREAEEASRKNGLRRLLLFCGSVIAR